PPRRSELIAGWGYFLPLPPPLPPLPPFPLPLGFGASAFGASRFGSSRFGAGSGWAAWCLGSSRLAAVDPVGALGAGAAAGGASSTGWRPTGLPSRSARLSAARPSS